MKVAKSYQNAEIISEIFDKDGKPYVKIKETCDRCGGVGSSNHISWAMNYNGICFKCNGKGFVTLDVRAYTDKEYARTQLKADELRNKREAERIANAIESNREYREKNGFENGYIMAILGNTYSIREELKDMGAKFSNSFGWYFFGGYEPKDSAYELHRVDWDDVSMQKGEYITLKSDLDLKPWFKKQTTPESPSVFKFEVKQKVQLELTIKSVYTFDTKYGTTYLHTMLDKDENVYIWSTASKKLNENQVYKLKGTVKEHKEYHDVKQTVLTRCSIV